MSGQVKCMSLSARVYPVFMAGFPPEKANRLLLEVIKQEKRVILLEYIAAI